jgi:hypothetical protein
MNISEETTQKLIEALNRFSESMNGFLKMHAEGIKLEPDTHETIRSLISRLEDFNDKTP